ncbi:MAG: AAA family ATPase, partial [Candidatus Caldarchaeum sp.]
VVIDSLTELQKLDMRAIMEAQYRKRPDTTDIDVPSQREWGKSIEHIRRVVRAFRDLEANTIFTALMSDSKDDVTGQVTYFPALPGKLKVEVAGFLDIVGYLYVVIDSDKEVYRKIQFTQTQRVVAKDRTSCLGDSLQDPTIPKMWSLITGKE